MSKERGGKRRRQTCGRWPESEEDGIFNRLCGRKCVRAGCGEGLLALSVYKSKRDELCVNPSLCGSLRFPYRTLGEETAGQRLATGNVSLVLASSTHMRLR